MIETPKLGDQSLVYMYGLSDFWTDMFADTQLVESLLSAETVQLAEAYSYFLQRSAGISLTDIQDKYETRIKLVLLGEDDLVDPLDLSSFRIDPDILSTNKISNRPILPTQTLSSDIHYDIIDNVIKFYKPIDELKFPIRTTSDGKWQYAVWFCDVEINEHWIDDTFGRLVGFTEEDAIFNYKSFLEGVYFLYTNGPNLAFIERGVNLAMGMPYARATEDVLDISQDSVTGNWFVFTATQAYEIPYGYRPDLVVRDTLTEGDVLSTWVQVNDYSTAGAWWYQIFLPKEVVANDVDPISLGRAIEGSTGDMMMQNFLKHHMFEVLITQPNGDITAYNTARDLVLTSKPEYTYPVFIWKVPLEDEIINLDDEFGFRYSNNQFNAEYCISPPSVRFMDRAVNDETFTRGTHWYNRVQGSMYVASLLGYGDWPDNGGWAPQFETIADNYLVYLSILMRTRGDRVSPISRGTVMRGWRGSNTQYLGGLDWKVPADSVYGNGDVDFEINERELTPLYMMSRTEMVDKMRTVDPGFNINGRNKFVVTGLNLVDAYETWMIRNQDILTDQVSDYQFPYSKGGLDIAFSIFARQTYVPGKDEMYDEDGNPLLDGTMFITRSTDSAWVCQWIRNDIAYAPTLFPVEDSDLTVGIESYEFDNIGVEEDDNGIAFNAEVYRVQTKRLLSSVQETLVITDGMYTHTTDYGLEIQNARAELTQYEESDSAYEDLGIPSRSYVVLDTPAVSRGFVVDVDNAYMTYEETLPIDTSNTLTLTETVALREEVLLIINGEFSFDYTIVGNILTLGSNPTSATEATIRYVSMRDEEVLPPGSSTYTLSEDSRCKIFSNGRLIEDWAFRRDGVTLTFTAPVSSDIIVRYDDRVLDIVDSHFHRSMIEGNTARFLTDRAREDGEYNDYLGQTVYMNRSGVPTLFDGTPAETTNVTRRLR